MSIRLVAWLGARLRRTGLLSGAETVLVGIGNKGPAYEGTRHNVGFDVLDHVAAQVADVRAATVHRSLIRVGRWAGRSVVLVKPQTYVNRSGEAVRRVVRSAGVPVSSCIVVVDDIHLPVGMLRVRRGGSDGGHNGLKSITGALGSGEFPRLRVGIGPAPRDMSRVDFVLGRFEPEEMSAVRAAIERAGEALACMVRDGMEVAMNRYNERRLPSAED